jgi:hypothetical protein
MRRYGTKSSMALRLSGGHARRDKKDLACVPEILHRIESDRSSFESFVDSPMKTVALCRIMSDTRRRYGSFRREEEESTSPATHPGGFACGVGIGACPSQTPCWSAAMHETRNFVLVLTLVAAVIWATVAWLVFIPEAGTLVWGQRTIAPLLAIGTGAFLFYALRYEDKLPDNLREVVGEIYYEADGLSFMPIVRVRDGMAELCVYYQNRYEGPVEAIVHLRPPEDSFIVREGMRDIHFSFRCNGGDFGVIHQPIAVPRHLQGEVITLELAAVSYYPRSHGSCWRRKPGLPCGTMPVDWSGSALKSGVHEGSNEMALTNPAKLHLALPMGVIAAFESNIAWRQEQLAAGEVAA